MRLELAGNGVELLGLHQLHPAKNEFPAGLSAASAYQTELCPLFVFVACCPRSLELSLPLAESLLTNATVKMRRITQIMRSSLTGGFVAAVLASFIVFSFGLSASEALHKDFHSSADTEQHECIVTLLAHGGVEIADTRMPVPQVAGIFAHHSADSFVVVSSLDHRLPPGRAPPVSFS